MRRKLYVEKVKFYHKKRKHFSLNGIWRPHIFVQRKDNKNIKIMKEKHFIRVEEAAEYLGVAKSHLYRLTKERLIKHYKSAGGRIIYFKIEDLDEYITHTYVTPMNELEKAVNYN